MKIIIKKRYVVYIHEVLCELGFEEEKKDYIIYLKAIRDNEGDAINHIHNTLLSRFPISTAKNIVLELRSLLLLDQDNNITNIGVDAIESGYIFEPMKGVYTLYTIKNSPFRSSIFLLSQDKIRGEDTNIAKSVIEDIGKTIKLHDNNVVKILNIENTGRFSNQKKFAEVELIFEKERWLGYLTYNNRKTKMDLSNKFTKFHLDQNILNTFELVPGSNTTIFASSENLTEVEIITFKGNKKVTNYNIPELQIKVSAQILDIPLLPKNNTKATEWAKRLFVMKYLYDYLTETEFKSKWEYMINENLQLSNYQIEIASIHDIIEESKDDSKKWYLLAPIDFNLEELYL